MKKIYYNKLIRDKIPEKIKKHGGDFEIKKLDSKKFELELLKKAGEEASGLLNSKTKEELISELADVLDVIEEIKKFKKIKNKQIEKAQKLNFKIKGGFEKRLFLFWSSDTGYKSNEKNIKKVMTNKKLVTTLCVIHQHPKILLGMKKRSFGAGRWNGFGGKLLEGESVEESARREMLEESGIEIIEMEKVGVMDFEFEGNPEIIEVNVFKVINFKGEPKETEEMKPEWFHIDEIPFREMWPDDVHWMPLFLKNKKFKGKFLFGEGDAILEQDLQEVDII